MKNMRLQLETTEVASLLLYICNCFSISVRLRNLIEFLGLVDDINPLSSLLTISKRKVVNLVLFYSNFHSSLHTANVHLLNVINM